MFLPNLIPILSTFLLLTALSTAGRRPTLLCHDKPFAARPLRELQPGTNNLIADFCTRYARNLFTPDEKWKHCYYHPVGTHTEVSIENKAHGEYVGGRRLSYRTCVDRFRAPLRRCRQGFELEMDDFRYELRAFDGTICDVRYTGTLVEELEPMWKERETEEVFGLDMDTSNLCEGRVQDPHCPLPKGRPIVPEEERVIGKRDAENTTSPADGA